MPSVETVYSENKLLKERIKDLEAQIAWFKRQVFAGSKSEKIDIHQLELMLGQLRSQQSIDTDATPSSEGPSKPKESKKRRKRAEAYQHLPISEEVVILPDEVKAAPEAYEQISEEVTEEVLIEAPKFSRRIIRRPKFRKKQDRALPPVIAPATARVVEGMASNELLIYILISKYVDHLPLYRQCAIFKRHGLSLQRQNLVRWVEKVAHWLKPIYNHIGQELLEGDYVQADETPINYYDPDYGEKKTRKGYLCGYSRPHDNVYFRWSTSRGQQSITAFLKPFSGILQSDAYQPYLNFVAANEGTSLAACWAHARRKFFEIKDRYSRECGLVLGLIAQLYQVEKQIRDESLDTESILELRAKKSARTRKWIGVVLRILAARHTPSHELVRASNYALKIWDELGTYLKHAHVAIDNNAMENAIRPTAVGKKNWLFVGHPEAGERSAIIYSILISCQRLQIPLQTYLMDVLRHDTHTLRPEVLRQLTPKNWHKRNCQGG